jgi:glycosyltransferase involved in cell wall biosynthesis
VPEVSLIKLCLLGASHLADDDRMFYREAVTLSRKYAVEVIGAGRSNATLLRNGVLITSLLQRSRVGHVLLLLGILMRLNSRRPDVLHCFDLESLATAILASHISGGRPKVIYDAHEHFPSLMAGYFKLPRSVSAALEFFLDLFERSLASFCDGFITDREPLTNRFAVYGKPSVTIRNVPSLSWFDDARQIDILEEVSDPIVVCFGNLSESKGLVTAIRANDLLRDQGIKVCLVLAGNLRDLPRHSSAGLKITGWLDYVSALPSLLKKSSIGLVLIKPVSRSYRTSPPTKLFHCMVSGLPVVASDTSGMRSIVIKENCGVLVNPDSVEQVAQAIQNILKDDEARKQMGKNARYAAERQYNWEMEGRKLMEFYRNLTEGLG